MMAHDAEAGEVNATMLAAILNISKSRLSHLVAEGKLDGSYSGAGRARRFDPVKAAQLLDVKLHPAQTLGNGAAAAMARRDLLDAAASPATRRAVASANPPDNGREAEDDGARWKRANADLVEGKALAQRRELLKESKAWVLSAEIERETRAAFASELAVIESMLRDAARAAADRLGVDYRSMKAVLMEEWRRHRERRRDTLAADAESAELTPDEAVQDLALD